MKALCYVEPRRVEVEDKPKPTVQKPTDAIVRVTKTSICGSDLHVYHGRIPGFSRGFVVGHEILGIVEEVGKDVRHIKPGDRTVVSSIAMCGDCWYCRRRSFFNCTSARVFGFGETFGNLAGGQADFVQVPFADTTLGVPDTGLSDDQVLFVSDILATAYVCAKNADIHPGDTVVVVGCGPVGILTIMCAQLYGPAQVLAVDMIDSRLKLAREHGAVPIDARQGDVGQRIKDMTGGRGADSVMEAVGTEAALASTFNMIRPKGTISVVGVFVEAASTLPISQAFFGEFNIRFGLGDSARYRDEMFELVRTGRLQPEQIITHRMKLEEAPKAYQLFDQREAFKVVLTP